MMSLRRRREEDAARTSDRGSYVPGFVEDVEQFVKEHRGRDLDEAMPIVHPGMVLDDRAAKAIKEKDGIVLSDYVQWREVWTSDLDCEGLPGGAELLIAFKRPEGKNPELLTKQDLNDWFRLDWKEYKSLPLHEVPKYSVDEKTPIYCPRWLCGKIQRSLKERIQRVEKRRKLAATESKSTVESSDSDSEEDALLGNLLDAKKNLREKRSSWDRVVRHAEKRLKQKKESRENELIAAKGIVREKRRAWKEKQGGKKDKEEKIADSSACAICFEGPRDHAMVPCGHRCACKNCSGKLTWCPVCRHKVEKAIRVWDS